MRPASFTLVLLVGLLAAGCLGGSSANAGGHPPVLDAVTRQRLLAEWHVAVSTAHVMHGPGGGFRFLSPRQLAAAMRRVYPSIPATTSFGPKDTLAPRAVFVLSPTAPRLDIATAAADGRYVHLIAVGRHRRHFEFAPL